MKAIKEELAPLERERGDIEDRMLAAGDPDDGQQRPSQGELALSLLADRRALTDKIGVLRQKEEAALAALKNVRKRNLMTDTERARYRFFFVQMDDTREDTVRVRNKLKSAKVLQEERGKRNAEDPKTAQASAMAKLAKRTEGQRCIDAAQALARRIESRISAIAAASKSLQSNPQTFTAEAHPDASPAAESDPDFDREITCLPSLDSDPLPPFTLPPDTDAEVQSLAALYDSLQHDPVMRASATAAKLRLLRRRMLLTAYLGHARQALDRLTGALPVLNEVEKRALRGARATNKLKETRKAEENREEGRFKRMEDAKQKFSGKPAASGYNGVSALVLRVARDKLEYAKLAPRCYAERRQLANTRVKELRDDLSHVNSRIAQLHERAAELDGGRRRSGSRRESTASERSDSRRGSSGRGSVVVLGPEVAALATVEEVRLRLAETYNDKIEALGAVKAALRDLDVLKPAQAAEAEALQLTPHERETLRAADAQRILRAARTSPYYPKPGANADTGLDAGDPGNFLFQSAFRKTYLPKQQPIGLPVEHSDFDASLSPPAKAKPRNVRLTDAPSDELVRIPSQEAMRSESFVKQRQRLSVTSAETPADAPLQPMPSDRISYELFVRFKEALLAHVRDAAVYSFDLDAEKAEERERREKEGRAESLSDKAEGEPDRKSSGVEFRIGEDARLDGMGAGEDTPVDILSALQDFQFCVDSEHVASPAVRRSPVSFRNRKSRVSRTFCMFRGRNPTKKRTFANEAEEIEALLQTIGHPPSCAAAAKRRHRFTLFSPSVVAKERWHRIRSLPDPTPGLASEKKARRAEWQSNKAADGAFSTVLTVSLADDDVQPASAYFTRPLPWIPHAIRQRRRGPPRSEND
ncbi:hypothetical protein DIPPA_11273 [Diplonema papillatum]|nr:hypothetical protein DIPPA_11273 [Diplonema papillatum]